MNEALAKSIYLSVQGIRQEPIHRVFHQLGVSQHYSAEELEKLQAKYLTKLLGWAGKTCAAYTRYQGAPLTDWPLLTKEMLSMNSNAYLSQEFKGPFVNWATSGSTGNPVVVTRGMESLAYSHASLFRAHSWYGIDIGAKEARLWGVPHSYKGKLRENFKDFLMNRVRASAYNLDHTSLDKFWELLVKWRPKYLFGYPSLLNQFALFVTEFSRNGKMLGLRAVISTSETLNDVWRDNIFNAFGCSVVNEYGTTEAGILAYECPSGGMHIPVEAVKIELLPTDIEGLGSVVVTDLHNYAMPIIRYKTGDLAAWDNIDCKCGRKLPKLKNIAGRESSIIETPDGRKIHTIIFYYSLCDINGGGIKQFQVARLEDYKYQFRLVPGPQFGPENLKYIKRVLSEKLGPGTIIECLMVDSIPLSQSGKFKDFLDERKT